MHGNRQTNLAVETERPEFTRSSATRSRQVCTCSVGDLRVVIHNVSLSLHPLCGGGDLLFLLSPPAAAATCFCSHSKTPTRNISKYLQYSYWPLGICLVIFFLRFTVSSTKSKMAAKILWRTLELELLH